MISVTSSSEESSDDEDLDLATLTIFAGSAFFSFLAFGDRGGKVGAAVSAVTDLASCSMTSDESESEDEDFLDKFTFSFLGVSSFFSSLALGNGESVSVKVIAFTSSSTTS